MPQLFTKTIIASALLFICSAAFAQRPLTLSKERSNFTYVYQLKPADMLNFYKHPDDTLNERLLVHPIDSFRSGARWVNTLPAGNYLKVSAEKNRLSYALLENHSASIQFLHNNYDHRFIVLDKQGNTVTDATVYYKGKLIKFDTNSSTWHSKPAKKPGIVQVNYANVANFFVMKEKDYNEEDHNQKGWLAPLWASIKSIFHKNDDDEDERRYNKPQKPHPYNGFLIYNKPKYKPHDTVRFKAFILDAKTKLPVRQKKLMVNLYKGYYSNDVKTIGAVSSYRDGGFEYSFVLGDSIKLDNSYSIGLTDPSATTKKSDDDNISIYQDHSIFVYGAFQYEEYELKSATFTMRTDTKEQHRGSPVNLYLKATDENDLPVADGRVNLTLTTGNIYSQKNKHIFIPDTLWTKQVTLDPVGETKVLIPDSLMPAANLNYQVYAQFLNSNNEQRTATQYISFDNSRYHINSDIIGDTLIVSYHDFGKETNASAFIIALNAEDDTISKQKVTLPAKTIVNPAASTYTIETDSVETDIELKDFSGGLTIEAERTADSIFVKVNNPRKLHFWYSVFSGEKMIDVGDAIQLTYHKPYKKQNLATFWVNYIWGGVSRSEQSTILYRKDQLSINVKQPLTVYPGQSVKTEIVVTDNAGQPVPNTDVTAWAITKKFNFKGAGVPYLGYNFKYRETKKPWETDKTDADGSNNLNWLRWGKAMGLDSIEYYKFTHPAKMYTVEEQGIDTITQIAPFVVSKGDVIPIHILYIDEKPVYFSQAQQLQRYSFAVTPGKHSVRFRTAHRNIMLDSVVVPASKKLILSINEQAYPGNILADTLSIYDADLINKYLITVLDNFNESMATLQQNNLLYYLNPNRRNAQTILAGPLPANSAILQVKGRPDVNFVTEPNYLYRFEPGLIKQKSIVAKYPFNTKISVAQGTSNYTQYVLTPTQADSLWQDFLDTRSNNTELFVNEPVKDKLTGRLKIEREVVKNETQELIKNIIMYRYDNPDFLRIYPGNTTDYGRLAKGRYRVLFLLRSDRYDILENVTIKPNGLNLYRAHILPVHSRDSVSIKIKAVIESRPGGYYGKYTYAEPELSTIKEAFNDKYTPVSTFGDEMSGQVTSQYDKLPIPGVSVRVKGTNVGTQTTPSGRFNLKVPAYGKLVFSFLGFESKEIDINPGATVAVALKEMSSQLSEVVVTGFGVSAKKNTTGSVATISSQYFYNSTTTLSNALAGKVAGLSVTADSVGTIYIRGNNTLTTGANPLYVVDGVPMETMAGINAANIVEMNVLKESAATALYGSRAANGAIIITTKDKKELPQATAGGVPAAEDTQTLRKNFSDYAYWQPKLITDQQGKASFTSVFPDDITNWRTFVVAVNGQRQSGFGEKQIKSFKPLSANFIAQQFAVEGDEMSLIGKVMNYNSTTAKVSRTFTYNGKIMVQGDFEVSNSKIDTLPIVASATDSLAFEYSVKRDNGYFDGEQRKVPVIKQGVQETKGIFEALDRDTTINLKFDPAMGPVTFRAEASALPALAEEAKRLREYKYLCNEQLASKLKGLLSEKRIKTFLNEPFKYERNILDVIKKLQQSRKSSGTWGWWADTNEELWISLHAIEALNEAQSMGYAVQLNQQKLTDYLVYQLESYRGDDKLICLQLLHQLGAKVDYAKYFGVIENEYKVQKEVSQYNRLKLLLLKQEHGISIKTDSLLAKAHKTMFGNMYWGEENYRFFDNSIQVSAMAYQIIKAEGKHPEVLNKIRGYFLEQRKLGEWRNTYESALILETLLPDLLQKDKQIRPSVLTLKGSTTETVTTFPYTATLKDNTISVNKTGSLPVYITGYQQFWNSKPEKVNKEFTVSTSFERKGDKRTRLKGGEAVLLKAEVIVKGDADFVMLEIPIPAGCSYESKEQQWTNNEVHREFFKEKVSIFCRKLKEGKYTFSVNLMPRYSGNYTLNPAKAEQMYFPVFYGRERMKKVEISSLVH